MHRLNQQMNKKQLSKRKDNADQSCVTQEITPDQVVGDSKWFLKRRATQLENQKVQQKKMQAAMQILPQDPNTLLAMSAALIKGMNEGVLPPQLAALTTDQQK